MSHQGQLAPPENGRERPDLLTKVSTVSRLTSEATENSEEDEGMKCKKCGGEAFKVKVTKGLMGKEERRLVCGRCGSPA